LVGLPFNEEEEEWFEKYLIEGDGRNCNGANETLLIRRMATGRLKEAASVGGLRRMKTDHVQWGALKDGIQRGLGPRSDVGTPFKV
jgi:hypothetical protein